MAVNVMTTDAESHAPQPSVDDRLIAAGWRRDPRSERLDAAPSHQMAVRYSREELDIRLVSDRGFRSVDVRPTHAGAEWFDLALLLEWVGEAPTSFEGAASFEQLVTALERRDGALERACSRSRWPVTKDRLHALEQARVRRLFPTLSREGD